MKKERHPLYTVCMVSFEGPVDFGFVGAPSFLLWLVIQPFKEACSLSGLCGSCAQSGGENTWPCLVEGNITQMAV